MKKNIKGGALFLLFFGLCFLLNNFYLHPVLVLGDNLDIKPTVFKASYLDDSSKNLVLVRTGSSTKFSIEVKARISGEDFVEGEVLVKYKKSNINLSTVAGRKSAESLNLSRSLFNKEDLVKGNISLLKIKDGKTVKQKIGELENDPNIEYAEPNYRRYITAIDTNDTNRGFLWGLDNTGQAVNSITGTNDADIDAPEAWLISETASSSQIIVAVIDSGVAYTHPDLIDNMWSGVGCKDERGVAISGGCNHGYDYEDGDNTPLPTNSSHGTHVAGIIAATKNNNKGIIGIAPRAKIMAIKSSLTVSDNIKSIDFAIQNGAKIINASYAGQSFSQSEYDAINRFKSAGGIFVAAAGNYSEDNDDSHIYPSDYDLDNIISVAATDQNDSLATFSNYGVSSVDVGAPGTNIYSAIAENSILDETFESLTTPNIPTGWIKAGTNNNWGTYALDNGSYWGKVLYGDLAYPYRNSVNTTVKSPTYNLSSSNGATIDFWTSCDTEYNMQDWTDYMSLEFSSNGGSTFTEYLSWDEPYIDSDSDPESGAVYHFEGLEIPSKYLNSSFQFRLRWITNSSDNNYDGCFVDDIKIIKFNSGTSEQYDYKSGTSMATPYVSGLAALIEANKPSLTITEVRNVILTTGDDVASLLGKTSTGKRINAYSALLSIMASSSSKAIDSFIIPSQVGTTTINETDHTVMLNVPYGTNVSALVPTITTTGVSVSPASGVAHDFTASSTYTVTAGDTTTQIYVVTVIVAAPSNIVTVTSSIYNVDNASSTITNIPYGTASSTFISQISGGDEVNGQSNQTWDHSNISNPVMTGDTLVVTAQDSVTTKTYNIIVNDPSSDAALRNIIISKGTLKPSFSSSTKNYTASVSSNIGSVTIKPTQYESHSVIKVNNSTTTSGLASLPISLAVGSNLINIEVTAQDNISTSTYIINVTRAKASSGGGGGGGGGISKPLTPVIITNTPAASGALSVSQFIELLIQIGVIPPEKVTLVKLILGLK